MTAMKPRIETPIDLISYFNANEILTSQFPDTTDDEFAMWAWLGKFAFENENEEWILLGENSEDEENSVGFTCYFEDAEKAWSLEGLIACGVEIKEKNVLSHLMNSRFSRSEIEGFKPSDRWIPYDNLLQRWTKKIGKDKAEALIDAKTKQGELEEYFPFSKNSGEKESAIFNLNKVQLLEECIFSLGADESKAETKRVEVVRGLTKQPIINAFNGLHFSRDQWNKALANVPEWLIDCRVAKGSKRASATWDPVLIGLALVGKSSSTKKSSEINSISQKTITVKQLDLVFMGLKDWKNEWEKKSDPFR